jgi:hypothetical protein
MLDLQGVGEASAEHARMLAKLDRGVKYAGVAAGTRIRRTQRLRVRRMLVATTAAG